MFTKKRARAAVRAVAPRENKARLLVFLDELPDQELAQWSIEEADDDGTIYDYLLLKAQAASAPPQARSSVFGHSPRLFRSLPDFLQDYHPPPIELASCVSSATQSVPHKGPNRLVPWHTFEEECQVLLMLLRSSNGQPPFSLSVPDPPFDTVGTEGEIVKALEKYLFAPLWLACAASGIFFEWNDARGDVFGLGKSGKPDLLASTGSNSEETRRLLVSIEVKASVDLCVPDGNLVTAHNAAGPGSKVTKVVAQLYNYLATVPYGVLVTDQQLFCMRREGSTLYCSNGVPVSGYIHCTPPRLSGRPSTAVIRAEQAAAEAAKEQFQLAGGHTPNLLSAAAALYCMVRMSEKWWQTPVEQGGGGLESSKGGISRAEFIRGLFTTAMIALGLHGPMLGPAQSVVTPLLGVSEGSYTSSDVFPDDVDPRLPSYKSPFLATARQGCVLVGVIGGQAAAVKVIDLWKEPEAREDLQREAMVYQRLKPVQGVFVPRLLAYGYLDGWQYFLATSLEGPSLSSDEGWLLDDTTTITSAVRALDAVHELGVLHGDIALRNLVFSPRGGAPDRVMLLDFGFAKLATEVVAEATGQGEAVAALAASERRELLRELGEEPEALDDTQQQQQGYSQGALAGSGSHDDSGGYHQRGGAPPSAVAPPPSTSSRWRLAGQSPPHVLSPALHVRRTAPLPLRGDVVRRPAQPVHGFGSRRTAFTTC